LAGVAVLAFVFSVEPHLPLCDVFAAKIALRAAFFKVPRIFVDVAPAFADLPHLVAIPFFKGHFFLQDCVGVIIPV
jgi:hypothetical protein